MMPPDHSVGAILLSMGAITDAELSAALDAQQKTRMTIGACLVGNGAISTSMIDAVLRYQDALRSKHRHKAALAKAAIANYAMGRVKARAKIVQHKTAEARQQSDEFAAITPDMLNEPTPRER